jgi:ATP-dependent Clp protease adapter protein ClpS
MPGELVLPTLRPVLDPEENTGTPSDPAGPWVVILYNCDCHDFDEVIHQLQLATGCGQARAEQIAEEAHHRGRAVAHTGAPPECERAAGILRSIGLQVETDRQ